MSGFLTLVREFDVHGNIEETLFADKLLHLLLFNKPELLADVANLRYFSYHSPPERHSPNRPSADIPENSISRYFRNQSRLAFDIPGGRKLIATCRNTARFSTLSAYR